MVWAVAKDVATFLFPSSDGVGQVLFCTPLGNSSPENAPPFCFAALLPGWCTFVFFESGEPSHVRRSGHLQVRPLECAQHPQDYLCSLVGQKHRVGRRVSDFQAMEIVSVDAKCL